MNRNISLIVSLIVIAITSFKIANANVNGLSVKFRRISESNTIPGPPMGPISSPPIYADEGMKYIRLKLTLENTGDEECVFDFDDVYISTEQDSLYRFLKLEAYFTGTKTKIKPHKKIDRIALFEFPETARPKELFIEDKRYTIIKEK
jgi:hypothetical protein